LFSNRADWLIERNVSPKLALKFYMRIKKTVSILLRIGLALLLVCLGLLITAGNIARTSDTLPDDEDGESVHATTFYPG